MLKNVLLVDDEPHIVEVVKEMLGRRDYNVAVASNGQEALERIATPPLPDIILLDIMMPEMDGATLAQELKQRPDTASIPIIFLTGLIDRNEVRRSGSHIGGQHFLAKPFDAAQLYSALDEVAGDG